MEVRASNLEFGVHGRAPTQAAHTATSRGGSACMGAPTQAASGKVHRIKPRMQTQVEALVGVHVLTNSSVSISDQPQSRALLVQSVRGVSERNDVPG
jgi:hypothetical protein